ncbi:MAG: hypothetical protein IJP66_01075 [Kiritimatiellae bacterium]|nr:hypothetical protein [Kiritimatiellia bacterium]
MNKMRSTIATALASAALLIAPAARAASGDISVTGSTQSDDGRLDTISLSLPASAAASTLWLAWGAADGGDQIGNWDDLEYLGDVPAGDTTWTGSIGTIPVGKPFARVFRIAADASLVELESVSATGSQYVITDFTATGDTSVLASFSMDDVSANKVFFSGRTSAKLNTFTLMHITGGNGFRFDYDTGNMNSLVSGTPGTQYWLDMDYTGLKRGTTRDNLEYINNYNDQTYTNALNLYSSFTAGTNLTIFALNTAGQAPTAFGGIVCYCLKAWTGTHGARTTLALDLVPCAKNGVAGLYDRLAGAFYPSETDTALVSGSPKTHSTCGDLVGSSAVLRPYGTDRTVTVDNFYREGRQPTADLTFTAGLADCALVAVHGPADAGDDIADWPNAAFLGTVPAATTAMTATIPWTIPDDTPHFFRFFLVSPIDPATGDSLRLFKGLHASSGAYILTGFTPDENSAIAATFSFDTVSATQAPFGGRAAAYDRSFACWYTETQGFRWDFSNLVKNSKKIIDADTPFALDMDYTGLQIDATYCYAVDETPAAFTEGIPLSIFGINTTSSGGVTTSGTSATCYGFKAWSDRARTTLALDLVPCECNGEAGFWDNAGAKFYGNSAGTGTLETTGAEILNADATVLSRTATLPLPPPSAFVITVR